MRTFHLFFGLFLAGTLFMTGCVSTDQIQILENRVTSLEMENNRQISKNKEKQKRDEEINRQVSEIVDELKPRVGRNETAIHEKYAETMSLIEGLRLEVQRLKGIIEETNYNVQQAGQQDRQSVEKTLERLDNAITKNFEKLTALEKYMGFEPSAGGPPTQDPPSSEDPSATPATPEQDTTEAELYAAAKKLLDDGDRENARIQFENFINRFPDSGNADNARFWIADSYYMDKWYEKAILEYQKVLEQYPDSNKTAAALLKQGYAFAELGEKANARLILRELIKKSPESNEAKYAAEKLKTLN